MKNIILFIVLCFMSICSAGTIDPKADDTKHLNYGSQHKCVLLLEGSGVPPAKEKYRASAVIIKPRWILTAAHVVNETSEIYVLYNNTKIKILDTITMPGFDLKYFGKNDLAICYLDKEIELDYYPELYNTDDEQGKICSLAGYGMTGTFSSGSIKNDGLKRAGSNIVDLIDDDLLVCSLLSPPKTELEFLISHGDSGGGLFISNKLAGIHSGIWTKNKTQPRATYSNYSGHTRISKFKIWIEQTIREYKTK